MASQITLPVPGDDLRVWADALIQTLDSALDGEIVTTSGGTSGVTLYDNQGRIIVGGTGLWVYDTDGNTPIAADIVNIDTQHLVDAAVSTDKIQNLAVTSALIADAAIVTAKIDDLAVNTAKIANLAVGSAQIQDAAITNAKIGLLAVDTANIADAAIQTAKIADANITTAKIADLAVSAAKIDNATITGAKIASATITGANIASATIGTANIALLAVTTGLIDNLAVTTGKINDLAVTTAKIANLAVGTAQIASAAITNAKINDLSADKINAGTLSADRIGAASITAGKLNVSSLSAISADLGTITAGSISAVTISSSTLSSVDITGGTINIGSGAFDVDSFGNTSVDTLGAQELGADHITVGSVSSNAVTLTVNGTANGIDGTGTSFSSGAVISIVQEGSEVGLLSVVDSGNSTSTAHGVRGRNDNKSSSGLVGPSSVSYDFFADGHGAYGPFTGGHDALLANSAVSSASIGDIVVDVRVIDREGISDTLTEVELSSSPMQKGAVGVLSTLAGWGANPIPKALRNRPVFNKTTGHERGSPHHSHRGETYKKSYAPARRDYQHVVMNSVGEGQMNVCGQGGDIEIGDLIVTSDIPGKGMRQGDEAVMSYTVAKAREAVTFSRPDEVKMIACIYLCG